MIDDEEIQKAVDYLRDSAKKAAQARANRIYVEEYRKTIKAKLMKRTPDLAVSAQEREAYADPEYHEHLEAIRAAVYNDEYERFMRAAAEAKIEAWRTFQANERAVKL